VGGGEVVPLPVPGEVPLAGVPCPPVGLDHDPGIGGEGVDALGEEGR
jgi:hypothetical protein